MNILRHDREVRKEKMLRLMVGSSQENVNCVKSLSTESFCFQEILPHPVKSF